MKLIPAFLLLLSLFTNAFAQKNQQERDWNQPVEPFKIIGNIYYVGASDITSYLITTPKGHILIDSGFFETVPQIKANIGKLGFKLEDVKYILNSHAHYDHAGGIAELKRLAKKAKFMASAADVPLLKRGGLDDPNFGDKYPFEAVTPDAVFTDGKKVRIGGTALKANITPGHTRGCTSWTTTVRENNINYNVIFVCSITAPGYNLIDNPKYPNIIGDYNATFERLKKTPVDVFLASHGNAYDLEDKILKLKAGAENPFIDRDGYRAYLERSEETFREQVRKQKENKP
jgi:metallo-beta-lactamase class B